MEHVLDAGQVDALLPGEELDHTNPPDVILRIAGAVRRRSLRFDEVLALVDHQRARVEVEDLARDTWREDRPSGRNRGRPLSFSHALTPLGAPSPACLGPYLYTHDITYWSFAQAACRQWRRCRGCRVELDESHAGDRAVHPAPPAGLLSDRGRQPAAGCPG